MNRSLFTRVVAIFLAILMIGSVATHTASNLKLITFEEGSQGYNHCCGCRRCTGCGQSYPAKSYKKEIAFCRK